MRCLHTPNLKSPHCRIQDSGLRCQLPHPNAAPNRIGVSVKASKSVPDISLSLLEDGPQTAELITVELPVSRPIAPTPSAVPIVHSKAYYIQHNQFKTDDLGIVTPVPQKRQPASGSLIETAIRSFDEQLDEIERNPPPVQKAIFAVSQGPIGQATAQGVQVAAKLTVQATIEAAKLAAPVGSWMLKQGTKTALNWMTYALTKEQQQASTVKLTKQGRKQKQR